MVPSARVMAVIRGAVFYLAIITLTYLLVISFSRKQSWEASKVVSSSSKRSTNGADLSSAKREFQKRDVPPPESRDKTTERAAEADDHLKRGDKPEGSQQLPRTEEDRSETEPVQNQPPLNMARMEKIELGELGRIEGLPPKHFEQEDSDGIVLVNMTEPSSLTAIAAIRNSEPALESGGRWTPSNCYSRCSLAVVMTYRERERNLKLLLQHLHPFLQRQCIAYQMFVVEPDNGLQFNRGMLKNIGFIESQKHANFDCVAFQDLDVLPENIFNLYQCRDKPRHLMTALDTTDYKRMEKGTNLFGGVVLFKSTQFQMINGYSNLYFGWGSEDTDLMYRALSRGLSIERPNTLIGRYKEAKHTKDPNRPIRNQALHARCMYRFYDDGLSSLKYEVIEKQEHPAYTWIHVRYNDTKYLVDGDDFVMKTDGELGQNFTKYMHITNRQSFPVPKQTP